MASSDTVAEPNPTTILDRPPVFLLSAVCLHCRKALLGDRDFGWWIHVETGEKTCSQTG